MYLIEAILLLLFLINYAVSCSPGIRNDIILSTTVNLIEFATTTSHLLNIDIPKNFT